MLVQVDPEAGSCLLQRLVQMQESGELCDFTITVFGAEIKVHKCVLAASSDYFHTSFSFSECSQASTRMDLSHLGCDVQVVKNVIQSFYTNQIDLDQNCLESVLHLVDYFMIEKLRFCIEMFMESTLSYLTALTYFRLALQYRLNSTGLCNCAKRMMQFRFHDYFIYKTEARELSLEVIGVLIDSDIFRHCNPLQLVEFILTNAYKTFEKLHDSGTNASPVISKDVCVKTENTFQQLSTMLGQMKPGVLETWKPRLVKYLKTWADPIKSSCFPEFVCHVLALEIELSDEELGLSSLCPNKNNCKVCSKRLHIVNNSKITPEDVTTFHPTTACSNPNCQANSNCPDTTIPPVTNMFMQNEEAANTKPCACNSKLVTDDFISTEISDSEIHMMHPQLNPDFNKAHETSTIEDTQQICAGKIPQVEGDDINPASLQSSIPAKSNQKTADSSDFYCNQLTTSTSESVKGTQPTGSQTRNDFNLMDADIDDRQCNILVVLAPSTEMASQLMVIDDGEFRPLLRSPRLELCFYDIEANTWYQRGELDFPIHGALLEKHSWRTAFLNNCLYMFSLGKEIGLEFNISNLKWTRLDCRPIFSRHKKNTPVRSVIPIKVGSKLVVLSMSREIKPGGDYSTYQHYFELDPISWTFVKVASVQDDTSDVPVTRWTVNDDLLITVKASTMMYNNLSRVQFVHFYNASTRQLESKEFDCTMESGVKLLVRDKIIYLLDREGWCRSYDMTSSSLVGMHRCPFKGSSTFNYLHGDEPLYPALTRVTCHAGSSRWEITTSRKSINACMQEMVVDTEGHVTVLSHPPPPFQFLTAMCQSTMSRSRLESMKQPHFVVVDNQMLDYSFKNSTEKSQNA